MMKKQRLQTIIYRFFKKNLQNCVHGNHGPLDIPDVGSGAEEVFAYQVDRSHPP